MTCRLPAQQVGPILQKEVYTTPPGSALEEWYIKVRDIKY